MTDQLRKAALDFLRASVEDPEETNGYYAIDSDGAIFWYKEKPIKSATRNEWVRFDETPYKRQDFLHWDSLLFTAKEVASAEPAEPPKQQPEESTEPTKKMGPFDIEREVEV